MSLTLSTWFQFPLERGLVNQFLGSMWGQWPLEKAREALGKDTS